MIKTTLPIIFTSLLSTEIAAGDASAQYPTLATILGIVGLLLLIAFAIYLNFSKPKEQEEEKIQNNTTQHEFFTILHPSSYSKNLQNEWNSVLTHLNKYGGNNINWLRIELNPLILEPMSLIIKNQLYFIFINETTFDFATKKDFFIKVAKEAKAIPCLLPMQRYSPSKTSASDDDNIRYVPIHPEWGLIHAETGDLINPLLHAAPTLIEMSDWELHSFAIQVIISNLEKEGAKEITSQANLGVRPSIVFEREGKKCWIDVHAVKYPLKSAEIPNDLNSLKEYMKFDTGYFASISIASPVDPNDKLYRGMPIIYDRSSELIEI